MKQKLRIVLLAGTIGTLLFNCSQKSEQTTMSDTTQVKTKEKFAVAPFGTMPDGTPISQYTLTNSQGMTMKVINLGGVITHLTAPDKAGVYEDVVLGYDSLKGYIEKGSFFGAI